MNLGIENRLALVVGATRGIGKEIADELWSEGAKVIGIGRTIEQNNAGRRINLRIDLMPEGEPERIAEYISASHGTPDIIIHVIGGSQGITDMLAPSSDWAKVWRLNLGIAHDLNRAFLPK